MSTFLLIWALSNLGLFGLASSMNKHQKQIYGQNLDAKKTRIAQVFGWVMLGIALAVCILQSDSLSNMISYWIGVLSFSALATGLLLSYHEQKLKAFAIGSALLALCCTSLVYLI